MIEALSNIATGLRISGTDEMAENAWRAFLAEMDADVRGLVDDREWLEAAMRHSFEVGWHTALKQATDLASRALHPTSGFPLDES